MSDETLLEEYFYIILGILHGIVYLSFYFPNHIFEISLIAWGTERITEDIGLIILTVISYPLGAYFIAKSRKFDAIFLKYKIYIPTVVILFISMIFKFWLTDWSVESTDGTEEGISVGYLVFIFILFLIFMPIISLYTFPTISLFFIIYVLTSYRQPIRSYRKTTLYPVDREYERNRDLYIDKQYNN